MPNSKIKRSKVHRRLSVETPQLKTVNSTSTANESNNPYSGLR